MVSLLLSLGSGLPGGREVGIMANPSSAHPISSLLRLAASVLSLGFGFGPILSLGRQGWPNGKPCLEGLLHDCGGLMNTASLLLSLTFSIQKPCAVAPGSRTQAQYIYYSLSGWGCRDSKLGFRFWGEARPGHRSCLNMKTKPRTCAAYPWGSWFGAGFTLWDSR